jgi:hypothetical protein
MPPPGGDGGVASLPRLRAAGTLGLGGMRSPPDRLEPLAPPPRANRRASNLLRFLAILGATAILWGLIAFMAFGLWYPWQP